MSSLCVPMPAVLPSSRTTILSASSTVATLWAIIITVDFFVSSLSAALNAASVLKSSAEKLSSKIKYEIARQPAGPAILFIVAIGLAGYALWRLVSAVASANLHEHAWAKRLGFAASGAVYLSLCIQAVALAVGSGNTNHASSNPSPVAATILRWPGGPLFLGLCGAGFIGGGLALLIWGWTHDYAQTFEPKPDDAPQVWCCPCGRDHRRHRSGSLDRTHWHLSHDKRRHRRSRKGQGP